MLFRCKTAPQRSPIFKFLNALFFLLSSIAFSHENIIISGAGPAGLATAISLRLAGHNVLLIEERDQSKWASREQVLGLSQENKSYLISLGLKPEDFSTVSNFSFYRSQPNGSPKPLQLSYGTALRALSSSVLSHNPEEFIVIGQLEKKLLDRYQKLGAE